MGREINNNVPEDGFVSKRDFLNKGSIADADLTVYNSGNPSKSIVFNAASLASGATYSLSPGVPGLLQYAAPVNGGTVTITGGVSSLVLEPAGTIAGATVVFPTAPPDGFVLRISSTAQITSLTITVGMGDTNVNGVTELLAGAFTSMVYKASSAKWYLFG